MRPWRLRGAHRLVTVFLIKLTPKPSRSEGFNFGLKGLCCRRYEREQTSSDVPGFLKSFGGRNQVEIVCELLASSMTVGDLAQRLHVSHYNASKHVRILREAGLVQTVRAGRHVRCQIAPELRKQLRRGNNQLDLGCCTFRFTRARSK